MRWPHHSCREIHQSLQVAGGGEGIKAGWTGRQAVPGSAPHPVALPTSRGLTHRMLSIQVCHVR